MKRIFALLITLITWLALGPATFADGPPYRLYLPVVVHGEARQMSDWKIIVPEATTNKVLNPAAGTTGNYSAVGATVTRSTAYSKYGANSYRVQSAADNQGMTLTLSALANATHYATLLVRGTLPAAWDWSLDGTNFHSPSLIETLDDNWSLYGYQFSNTEANGSTTLRIYQNGAGSGDFYIDGVQVEEKEHRTTHCNGNEDGCSWNGSPHASTSTRSAMSRAGGRVYDLQTDYHLDIGGMSGLGAAPQKLNIDSYATLPGGELNNVKIQERVFTLTGVIRGTSMADLHANRQALLDELSPDKYPGRQPVRLHYTGAAVQKQIAAHYETGLEGDLRAEENYYWERVAIRFIADDPYWYEIGESAVALDTNDSATFRIVAARLKSTGQWDDLGPPDAAGTYTAVYAIAEDDNYVYVGGDFLNFDNVAAADYIVRYNKQSGAWSALGSGMNGIVDDLVLGPDGTLYAGGSFTTAGGGGANRIAKWNGSAWSALGTGMNGAVETLAIGLDGTLYAGGSFTTAGGGGANYIAKWDGSAWSALGTGMDDRVETLAIGPDGGVYAGGLFTTAGGGGASHIAKWDGSAWSALGTGLVGGDAAGLAINSEGILYAAGDFATAGGNSVNNIALWSGTAWTALGSGVDDYATVLAIGKNGMLYVGGAFASAGGITLTDCIARWNGSSWAHVDIDLPGSGTEIVDILASKYADPGNNSIFDLWVGFNKTGTGYFAGLVTATNNGTAPVYPKIIVGRSGGTSATLETIRNETTGKELLFNYSLLDGETLTIDFTPTQRSIVSNFFGPRPDAVLPNCDFGTFTLRPGDNDISAFVNVTGAPTITAYMSWIDAYKSQD
jgi:hypothetical protein